MCDKKVYAVQLLHGSKYLIHIKVALSHQHQKLCNTDSKTKQIFYSWQWKALSLSSAFFYEYVCEVFSLLADSFSNVLPLWDVVLELFAFFLLCRAEQIIREWKELFLIQPMVTKKGEHYKERWIAINGANYTINWAQIKLHQPINYNQWRTLLNCN